MKPRGTMLHSQGLSNNTYPELNQSNFLYSHLFLLDLLSFHLCQGLPKDLFPVNLPVKIIKSLLPSSILATSTAHFNLLDLITLTILGERYKPWSSLLWNLLHSPFSSHLEPNICLEILFSNTLSLHSSLNVRDHTAQLAILVFCIF